jgi:hypothetical protein
MNATRRDGSGGQRGAGRLAAALAAALGMVAAPVLAQVPTGTILGHVQDTSGARVPGVSVTATNLGTQYSRTTTTDGEGQYALRLLPLGTYKLDVALAGFKTFSQTGILVEVGRNARIDATLEAGGIEEVVSVEADASLVETSSSALSRTVGQKEVLNLPLVNRDLYSLLSITGGVSSNSNENFLGAPGQFTTISGSNRGQMGTVSFQLDGGNNTAGLRGTGNAAPNPEAVQEFRVVTNSYAAEYGRYQAGVIDVVTKSGTNQFHGAAYGYFRDESLNANRWAPPGVTAEKDPLDRKQFGVALGGPIVKDKTFFFASYSGLRQEGTYYRNSARVPTALERQGNFSQSAQKPRDPLTGQPFPGGIIPSSRFDPAAFTIQERYVPQSNLPDSFYEIRVPDPYETDEASFKLDHNFSSSSLLALSYFYQKGTDTQPLSGSGNIPWVDRDFTWTQHNVNLAHTWTLSPTTINQFRATYVRQFGGRINNPTTSLGDLNSSFTVQGDPTLPRLTVSGYFTGQVQIAGPDAGSDYWGFRDTLSLNRGNHSFKLGAEVSYESIVHDTLLDNYGVFSFNGSKTGNAYADFLLGLPATMTQDAPVRKTDSGWYLSLFAQDDWRVHTRLTLNLGLRYDLQFPLTDPDDRKLAYAPGQQSVVSPTAPEGLLFPGDPGIGRGIVKTDANNIAPRVGLAWDPWGDGKTSVRAAFGIFYGSITGNEWNTTADNQPFAIRQSFPQVYTLSDPYRNTPGGNPFPYLYDPANPVFRFPAQVFGPSLDFVWPYTYQMNLTLQREILRDYSLSASYVGALGRKLAASVDRNYPVYGPGATTGNVNARRPYQPGVIGAARVLESAFGSDYHALQLAAEKRGTHFSFKGYYTFSKALEDTDYQGGGLPAFQNTNKLFLERARTSFDRTHVFTLSGIWRIDYVRDGSALKRGLLNGWTLSGILSAGTGVPLTIGSGLDRNLDGLTSDRADVVGDWELDGGRSREELIEQWFDTTAFAQPAIGTDGTAGRNTVEGPGFRNVDLGLFKDIGLGRGMMLQLRAEATNVFNIVNLSNPGTGLNAPSTFGKIRTAGTMRQIQLGARLTF